jgi:WD repeat-containing protein 55
MPNHEYLDSVECSDQPLDFSFHPTRENILAAALVDGTMEVHDIRREEHGDDEDDEPDSILSSLTLHAQTVPDKGSVKSKHASCRAIKFSTDGERIYTGGSAGDLVCVDAERVCKFTTEPETAISWRVENATEGFLNPLVTIYPFHNSTTILATGDDLGGVRIWDERIRAGATSAPSHAASSRKGAPQGCVLSWKENSDYISDMELSQDGNTLLASSADGRLSIFDLRMAQDPSIKTKPDQKSFRLSDDQDDELLSLKIMKNGKKVVCGTQEGVLSVFSWGVWGDCSDRFPGHPSSIDALLKVDEDTLLTGSSDGLIRVVQIHPDKLLGVLGNDHGGFPIERLGFNASRGIVGSISHDVNVHLWDATVLQDGSDDDESNAMEEEEEDFKPKASSKVVIAGNNSDDDWDHMDTKEDSDSDSDGSDEEEGSTVNDKRTKRLKNDNEKFFDDL